MKRFLHNRFKSNLKHLAVFVMLALISNNIKAVVITIPSANTNTGSVNDPMGMYYGYERTAMIYTAAEIGQYGTITDIGFYLNSVSTPANGNVKIYLKQTTSTTFSASTVATEETGATLVFNGTVSSFTASSWKTVTLSTLFSYTANNLEVILETNFTGTGGEGSTGKQFRYSTAASAYQVWNQDNTAPTGNGTVSNARPNIQLSITYITSSSITGSPFCAGASVSVPYTIGGTFNGGNIFTAQLSSSAGSFAAPTNIGTLASTAAGTISATIPANAAGGAAYRIRVVSDNPVVTGSDNGANLTITALPSAAGAITTGTATVCQSQNGVAYAAAAIGGATSYGWSYSGTGFSIASGSGSNSITANFSASATTGNLTIYGINACGNGTASANYTITVNSVPATPGTITGTVSQCPNAAGEVYSIAAVAGATSYSWSVPTGWSITAGGTTNSVTVTTGGLGYNGNVTVTASNTCGTSAAQTLAVAVTGIPSTPGTITGIVNQTAAATGQTYSITAVSGATTYTWSVPTGWSITSVNGTPSITITTGAVGQNGNITVTAGNACGTSAAQALAVYVTATPPNAGPDQYICSGTTTALMAATASAGGVWSLVTGPNTPNIVNTSLATTQIGTVTSLVTGTYVFRWTVGGSYDDVIIIKQ